MRGCGPHRQEQLNSLSGRALLRHAVAGGFLALVLISVLVAPASAHGWQNTTTADGHTLGIHPDPENPVAGTETDVLARIQNASAPGNTHRVRGASNETVAITVTGPNGSCDRLTATMPKNDSYFTFSYRFPTAGTYDITAKTTIDGEPVTFRTEQWVAASATSAEDTPQTETRNNSSRQWTRTADAPTTQPTETGSNHDALLWKLTTIQFLSGASVVVAAGALWAAVLAYRGTD